MSKIEITPKAPVSSAYVTIGTDGVLTAERNLTGTANQITITDNGAGSTVVLSTPQDIATTSSPQFANLTITDGGDIKPSADSTTAINIAQADGTNFVSFDSTNKRVGIGATPDHTLDVAGVIKTNTGIKTGDFVATPTSGDVYIKRASNNFGVNYMGDLNYAFAAGSGFGDARIATAGSYKFWVTDNGNIVMGAQAALATNATNGFAYIPTCAGTPTGTPTAYTGKVPLVFDTTGVKLWIYTGGSWKGVVVA